MNIPPLGSGVPRSAPSPVPASLATVAVTPEPAAHPPPEADPALPGTAINDQSSGALQSSGATALSLRAQETEERKRVALTALRGDRGIGVAAEMAGVNPSTLFRWRRSDPRFVEALKQWATRAEESTQERMLVAGEFAADTLVKACRSGDLRASLMVLKSFGRVTPRATRESVLGGAAPMTFSASEEEARPPVTAAAGKRRIRLDVLERLIEEMDLDEPTRDAYRGAFARHRALVEAGSGDGPPPSPAA